MLQAEEQRQGMNEETGGERQLLNWTPSGTCAGESTHEKNYAETEEARITSGLFSDDTSRLQFWMRWRSV